MQDNLFNGIHFGSDPSSGVDSPDFKKVAEAYNIKSVRYNTINEIEEGIDEHLNSDEPVLIELNMVRNQLLIPRVQSRKDENGAIVSGTLDSMFPFLSEQEIKDIKTQIELCEI
jgi:acetolactate synthase-1/2/3 large subunit